MKTKAKTETFKVTSGSIVLGDPCYETNHTCKARRGAWTAHVVKGHEGFWGERVRKVVVHHADFNPADPKIRVEEKGFSVDSGQAGVFDGGSYGSESFYDQCCTATLGRMGCGYLRGGFVTSSGYGDGFYGAEIMKVDGEAVCVEITFISDD